MRATVMHAAGDVRIEDVPDPSIVDPTDAIVRVTSACICGSDLWPYADMEPSETGQPMGHEAIGVVEDVGDDVRIVKRGDLVVMPFAYSDGSCEFCHEGLHTACVHVGFFGNNGVNGAQAEALRVPRRRRHALPAAGRGGARAHAVAADAVGRPWHRTPRRGRRRRPAGRLGGGRGRRRRWAVRRDRRQAARGRADHHHGPPRGPHGARARARRHRRRCRARRRGRRARPPADPRRRRARGPGMRRNRAVDADLGRDHTPGRLRRPGRRPALSRDPTGPADVLQERQGRRRPCVGARLHRRAAPGHPRRPHRARQRVRPHRRSRRAHARGQGHVSAGGVETDVAFEEVGEDVNDAIDAAYRDKYRRDQSYVPPMVSALARATTLKLVPRAAEVREAR